MSNQRRSYEQGHKPKCLVVVDDSAEGDRAVYYASRWAMRVGGGVVMLRVIETEDRNQQWLGVADIMREGVLLYDTPGAKLHKPADLKARVALEEAERRLSGAKL